MKVDCSFKIALIGFALLSVPARASEFSLYGGVMAGQAQGVTVLDETRSYGIGGSEIGLSYQNSLHSRLAWLVQANLLYDLVQEKIVRSSLGTGVSARIFGSRNRSLEFPNATLNYWNRFQGSVAIWGDLHSFSARLDRDDVDISGSTLNISSALNLDYNVFRDISIGFTFATTLLSIPASSDGITSSGSTLRISVTLY